MSTFYRVVEDGEGEGCAHCGHGKHWTIVSGEGESEFGIGTAWGDKELAEDICEFMNMAFGAGEEQSPKLKAAMEALTELVFMARTAFGSLRDPALSRACAKAEAVIGQKVPACARRKPEDQVR